MFRIPAGRGEGWGAVLLPATASGVGRSTVRFLVKKSLQTMIACDENGLSLRSVSGGNGTGFTEEEAVWERRIPTHRALQMSCTK